MDERERRERKLAILSQRAQALGALKAHPSWGALRDVFKGKRRRYFENVTSRLMGGTVIDQRELDFQRGFYAGAQWLLDNVENAEEEFEKAMQQARRYEAMERE